MSLNQTRYCQSILSLYIFLILRCSVISALLNKFSPTIEEREKCHRGYRNIHGKLCNSYINNPATLEHLANEGIYTPTFNNNLSSHISQNEEITNQKMKSEQKTKYPTISDHCLTLTWFEMNEKENPSTDKLETRSEIDEVYRGIGPWGNCVNITTDDTHRYITSNSLPDYYFNPYCPFGLKGTYCVPNEPCPFPDLLCGVSKSQGFTEYGDVWVPMLTQIKIPLEGNPTLADLPRDMYECNAEYGCEKNIGPAIAVAKNGVNIQGPNDAGDLNVDEAGFQLMCGGHVTPPVGQGPMYHYHKAPDCAVEFTNASIPVKDGGNSLKHGTLFAYAIDGFGIYTYEDHGGQRPIVDECGGHFGSVVEGGNVVYHYHARTSTPYHFACQGPALGKCAQVQYGNDYCGPGCGADVCVQPGTDKEALLQYLEKFNNTWLHQYTVNEF